MLQIYTPDTLRRGNNKVINELVHWGDQVFGRRLTESDLERVRREAASDAKVDTLITQLQASFAAHVLHCDEQNVKRERQHEENSRKFEEVNSSILTMKSEMKGTIRLANALVVVATFLIQLGVAFWTFFHHAAP